MAPTCYCGNPATHWCYDCGSRFCHDCLQDHEARFAGSLPVPEPLRAQIREMIEAIQAQERKEQRKELKERRAKLV